MANASDVSSAAFVDNYRAAASVHDIVVAMTNDIGSAAFCRADYRIPLVAALLELCQRVSTDVIERENIRELAESYGLLMSSIANIDGLMACYTRAQVWPTIEEAHDKLLSVAAKLQSSR